MVSYELRMNVTLPCVSSYRTTKPPQFSVHEYHPAPASPSAPLSDQGRVYCHQITLLWPLRLNGLFAVHHHHNNTSSSATRSRRGRVHSLQEPVAVEQDAEGKHRLRLSSVRVPPRGFRRRSWSRNASQVR
ncbi:Hypothetical protein SMAX5B_010722 [Scophthalmus maximus]|uniref:Uncharacterized protein n=1 Tax=Scophthalmus maximus TaxID=52904 RepID=A0A2U9B6I5_SCOMX|nr:Hypothetical protein SMAX5B_010722 [Scophthalmus maximus]